MKSGINKILIINNVLVATSQRKGSGQRADGLGKSNRGGPVHARQVERALVKVAHQQEGGGRRQTHTEGADDELGQHHCPLAFQAGTAENVSIS